MPTLIATHVTATLIGISIGIVATMLAMLYVLDPNKSAVTYVLEVYENGNPEPDLDD